VGKENLTKEENKRKINKKGEQQKNYGELDDASCQFLRRYCRYCVPPPTTGSSRRLPVFYGACFVACSFFYSAHKKRIGTGHLP
jgi:hypothetical protein